MTLLVSVLTATLFAVFGPPYVLYQYWFTWTPIGTIVGTVIYLALAGGGGGFLGWFAAEVAMKASPTQNPWVDGIIYGIAGSFALRADFSSRHVRSTSPHQTEMTKAASLLNASLKWTTSLLDTRADRAIETWVNHLPIKSLLTEAYKVTARINRQEIDDKAKNALNTRLVEAMELARSAGVKQEEGRSRVRDYVAEFMSANHTPRPGVMRSPKPAPKPSPPRKSPAQTGPTEAGST
ncbi:hypothetical protein AB0L70_16360 [Kribbella sp. NPDC051952]|uniref:hypothetical protein n=1 Tax=Kribbella sp. NPDC051952 TaxID=3154851 RepID=UPI00343019D2